MEKNMRKKTVFLGVMFAIVVFSLALFKLKPFTTIFIAVSGIVTIFLNIVGLGVNFFITLLVQYLFIVSGVLIIFWIAESKKRSIQDFF